MDSADNDLQVCGLILIFTGRMGSIVAVSNQTDMI
jgi:hypothetical protein